MNQWESVRQLARSKRLEVESRTNSNKAADLISAAETITSIKCEGLRADDPLLRGAEAALYPDYQRIWYNREIDPIMLALFKAHEFAHHWLEDQDCSCSTSDLDARLAEEKSPLGVDRVESYSPKERNEAQANVFAREFLLPADKLRAWFTQDHWSAADIATYVGVPEGLVFHQLIDALLLPSNINEEAVAAEEKVKPKSSRLDPSQEAAAHVPAGPLLVEAGPGTGKTHTLVGRIEYLISTQKVSPKAILVLTFSNKAAEEMRKRLAQALPDQAPSVWMGTFHAFGLEMLRKYGYAIGLATSPKILDPVSALLLMEQLLPRFELNYYLSLYDPTLYLGDFLKAISRAKDELVIPEKYRQMAEQMVLDASNDEERASAEKVLEVAGVYTVYQNHLDQEKLIDFGDLIAKTVQILTDHSDIRQDVRNTYQHILVDEYQDVNRACALMLKQVAGDGKGLWVVGDARQSIYRFRGAAPKNIAWFATDFPGAETVSLRQNYRTQPQLVKTFSALAPQMGIQTTIPFEAWETDRQDEGGAVLLETADNLEDEGERIAREIQYRFKQGIHFRDQAVLCRSHTNLARIAALLEQHGIPILYIGDLFEREEIRDLLSLIELADGDSRGFVRVATFPQYHLSKTDLQVILSLSKEEEVPFPQAIGRYKNEPTLTEMGRNALDRIDQHLQGICFGHGTWALLTQYLFNRSEYLLPLLNETRQVVLQQRLAIYQFLRFVYEQDHAPADGKDLKRRFLDYVRRLEIFDEEKQLRQIPEAGQSMDAVRFLTIHGSKGLEFKAVYLPILGKGIFPSSMKPETCIPPKEMITQDPTDAHNEEEVCLFFVALSRARDVLCLSRAERYNNRGSNPSDFLSLITSAIPPQCARLAAPSKRSEENSEATSDPAIISPFDQTQAFEVERLELYLRCPRRFYYEEMLGFSSQSEETAFLRFHRYLRELLNWVQEEYALTGRVEIDTVMQKLASQWVTTDLVGNPFEPIYRKNAEAMMARALQVFSNGRKIKKSEVLQIRLTNGIVLFSPDHIEIDEEGKHILRRMRTGRISYSELGKSEVYGLYHRAAQQLNLSDYQVEVFSLTNGQIEPANLTGKKIEAHCSAFGEAIQGILTDQFPPKPKDSRRCPRCPNYFICPAMPTA